MKTPGFKSALLIVLVAGMTALALIPDPYAPPPFGQLTPVTARLLSAPELVKPGGRGSSPYAVLHTDRGTLRLDYLCFLSDCAVPPALASLKPGASVVEWAAHGHLYQLESDGRAVVAYQEVEAAFAARRQRHLWLSIAFAVLAVGLVARAIAQRRKPETLA